MNAKTIIFISIIWVVFSYSPKFQGLNATSYAQTHTGIWLYVQISMIWHDNSFCHEFKRMAVFLEKELSKLFLLRFIFAYCFRPCSRLGWQVDVCRKATQRTFFIRQLDQWRSIQSLTAAVADDHFFIFSGISQFSNCLSKFCPFSVFYQIKRTVFCRF